MIAIALGIVFIVIVVTVGVSFQGDVKKLFESGPFKPVKQDTTYATGTSSGTGKLELPVNKLSGTPNSVKITIAKKLVECYNRMRAQNNEKGANKFECEKVEVTSLTDGSKSLPMPDIVKIIRENTIDNNVMGLTGGLAQSYRDLVINRLTDGWKQLNKGEDPNKAGTVDVGVIYLICADLNGGRDDGGLFEKSDNLFMARNLPFDCDSKWLTFNWHG